MKYFGPLVMLFLPLLTTASPLTLQEARRKAMENNHRLKATRLAESEAAAQRKMAEAMRLPRIDFNSSFIRTDQPASAFALTLNQKRFSMADFSMNDPNRPDALDTWLSSLTLSMPLYTGGRIRNAVGTAREMEGAAEAARRRAEQEIEVEVTRAYLGGMMADEYVTLLAKALQTVGNHVAMAQSYYDNGSYLQADHLLARGETA